MNFPCLETKKKKFQGRPIWTTNHNINVEQISNLQTTDMTTVTQQHENILQKINDIPGECRVIEQVTILTS